MAIKDPKRRDGIARKLRGLRAEANLTQEQVGAFVNIDKASVGRYEKGIACMDAETAWDMANLYGVSLDDLVGREWPKSEAVI